MKPLTADASYQPRQAQNSLLWRAGRALLRNFYDRRGEEHAFAMRHLQGCARILDVACGNGRFLELARDRVEGIDINPESVHDCTVRGLKASVGDALNLPYDDNSFDGVHSSHVIQVFAPAQAVQYVRELFRVCKPGGIVVIVALCDKKNFWVHPENVRPYPPMSIFNMFSHRWGDTALDQSLMWPGAMVLPDVVALRLRRPPLIAFGSSTGLTAHRIGSALNALQYGLLLRKYWTYDAYALVMRKR